VLLRCGFSKVETRIMDDAIGRALEEKEEKELLQCVVSTQELRTQADQANGKANDHTSSAEFTWFIYANPDRKQSS